MRPAPGLRSPVTRLEPRLYSIGAPVPVKPALSWLPGSADGWISCQCYLCVDHDNFVIVDSGTGVVWSEVREGLAEIIAGDGAERTLVMTRREPDCAANVPRIIQEFGITSVYCGGGQNALDFFALFDDAATETFVKTASTGTRSRYHFFRPNDQMRKGAFIFEAIRPPIRVCPTIWVYERSTRSLFCSDMWGVNLSRPHGDAVPAPARAFDLSPECLCEFLAARFDWLCGADTEPIADNIVGLFERLGKVERICPNFGCPIEGSEAVNLLLNSTLKALALISKRARTDPMIGFSGIEKERMLIA